MSKKTQPKSRTWAQVIAAEQRTFPPGHCVTRIIPDKRNKPAKHKKKEIEVE